MYAVRQSALPPRFFTSGKGGISGRLLSIELETERYGSRVYTATDIHNRSQDSHSYLDLAP